MNVTKSASAGIALILATVCVPGYAQQQQRTLNVVIEFAAEQAWQSETEEFGKEFSKAESEQRYALRTTLVSNGKKHSRNILDPNQEKRLKAKTIYLARQAMEKLAAAGKPLELPKTSEQKRALTQKMQEEQFACGGNAVCRRDTAMLYASIFAALQYPEALEPESGEGRYLYFEPAADCEDYSRVTMDLAIEGAHYNKGEKEVVPFTENRSADTENPSDDIPLCQRFLAVIDTQDDAQPVYLENFYLPSAIGETVVTELDETRRKTERQPMPTDVLGWITAQLKHTTATGSREESIRVIQPLSGISEDSGTSQGQAKISMRWSFLEPGVEAAVDVK